MPITLHIVQETPSTMAVARELLAAGDATTQAVLAETQTAGRGRLGRVWQTFRAPYSMACTYIVRQPCAHLPLLAALAVHEAVVAEFPTAALTVKWPNDVLLNNKKICGVLCEGLNERQFLVGVGLNLQPPPEGLPESFVGGFIGSNEGAKIWAERIGACLFNNLALYNTQGWSAFNNAYSQACSTFGQHIKWLGAEGTTELTGLARGLNQQGHLELVADDGTVHIIHSGEIIAQSAGTSAHPKIIAP